MMSRVGTLSAPFVVLTAMAGAVPSAMAQAPSFSLVGFPPGTNVSHVTAVSADGQVAAGRSNFGGAFTWTAAGGRLDLVPTNRWATGISGDGLTVVGGANSSPSSAFAWTQAGGFRNIGVTNPLPGYQSSSAVDANFDGSIVVGNADNGVGSSTQAFRWTQAGGTQGLGAGTKAFGISGDGSTVVGESGTAPFGFTWTSSGGIQFLQGLSGSNAGILARAINHDGSIVVGRSGNFAAKTTMWTNGVPMELPNMIASSVFTPRGVSNSGDIVAGIIDAGLGGMFAGVWTSGTNTLPLADYLAANGVVIPAGVVLEDCTAISADGRTFAGYTSGSQGIQGLVATISPPCPADLDNDGLLINGGTRDRAVTVDDLLFLLTAFEAGNMAADLDNGSNTGTRDSAVTIEDLLYFLGHFEEGC